MSKWSDGYIITNGLKLHYYRTGGNKPQVIFNHGAGDDGLCWTRVVKELEADYDVIMTDARGHGKSASGKGDYSSSQRVEDLAGLIGTLKLDQPIIGGHSMGADTSLRLAAKYPNLASGVFLEDPPIVLPGETVGPPEQPMKLDEMGRMMRRFMMMFKLMPRFIGIRMARKFSPTYPDDEINPWTDSKRRVSFNFLNSMNMMKDILSSDPFEAFKRIQVPVILFIGDREKMSIVSREAAQKAAETNTKLRVVHLEGASHDIRRTRFDGYMPALKSFLDETHRS